MSLESLLHELDPHRQRGATTGLAITHAALVVETDPGGGHDLVIESTEPRVDLIVGGSGLASDILAPERLGAHRGAALHDLAHHRAHDEGVLRGNHARRVPRRGIFADHLADLDFLHRGKFTAVLGRLRFNRVDRLCLRRSLVLRIIG